MVVFNLIWTLTDKLLIRCLAFVVHYARGKDVHLFMDFRKATIWLRGNYCMPIVSFN